MKANLDSRLVHCLWLWESAAEMSVGKPAEAGAAVTDGRKRP